MGTDPELVDPENGNYELSENSPATGYGCSSFEFSSKEEGREQVNTVLVNDSREYLSGLIDESLNLTASEIHVTDNVTISDGVILSFEAGCKVIFDGYYKIDVKGTIFAEGTADNRIEFSSIDGNFFGYNSDEFAAWNGIEFNKPDNNNVKSKFSYCIFQNSKAIGDNDLLDNCGAVFRATSYSNIRIENSIFKSNYAIFGGCFYLNMGSDIEFINNLVYENKAYTSGSMGVINYSNPRIYNNTIINNEVLNENVNFETGIVEGFISKPIFYNNIMLNNIDHFYEDFQLFCSKKFHVHYNVVDFDGYYDSYIEDNGEFTEIEPGIFTLNNTDIVMDNGTNDLPWGIELPETDILGNVRLHNGVPDIGAIEVGILDNSNDVENVGEEIAIYPNPFNPQTTISFTLEQDGLKKDFQHISVDVYNLKGQLVKSLVDENRVSGNYNVVWNGYNNKGSKVSSGVYFCKIRYGNKTLSKKMLLLK